MQVPFLDLGRSYSAVREAIEKAVLALCESQQFVLGPAVERFEQHFARYVGSPYAIACASGTDAILLALMAFDVGPGDEVITTPFTFFATASTIHRTGARPVFADIDPRTFNIDPELVEEAISGRTKAIIPVHLFGQCAAMERLKEIAAPRGIALIEDACQAVGATRNGRPAGTLGDAAAFSFYPTKNLGGFGDGGMITTASEELALRLRSLRVHGTRGPAYVHEEAGLNSRLDALQAVVLDEKLHLLDQRLKHMAGIAALYEKLLDSPAITLPATDVGNVHTYNYYSVRIKNARDEVCAYLRENGIGHNIYYPLPLHLQPCFRSLGWKEGDLPESERAAKEVIALPIFPGLRNEEVEAVAGVLLEAVERFGSA